MTTPPSKSLTFRFSLGPLPQSPLPSKYRSRARFVLFSTRMQQLPRSHSTPDILSTLSRGFNAGLQAIHAPVNNESVAVEMAAKEQGFRVAHHREDTLVQSRQKYSAGMLPAYLTQVGESKETSDREGSSQEALLLMTGIHPLMMVLREKIIKPPATSHAKERHPLLLLEE